MPYTPTTSRTQHKLMLQRQSFLADDKNYINHPANMRKLTQEMHRISREYQFLRQFENPWMASLKRVMASRPQQLPPGQHNHTEMNSH
ncbi:uncharacterized protein BYT42DRAFT_587875 [Radiomyces spectabilis]|uniref:uncharacterized protein n=1 Tax=Radiomyces spectabilis TaxID=64574 RepID=UPI00221E5FA4|nr:uncharacterized protein BYT42DRAFT_587875 [Radiomyces spectabilis]KAI8366787.1 hypothetical protein BYT42DRAFT_587875 [Radiomyces spectabilis]